MSEGGMGEPARAYVWRKYGEKTVRGGRHTIKRWASTLPTPCPAPLALPTFCCLLPLLVLTEHCCSKETRQHPLPAALALGAQAITPDELCVLHWDGR